MSYLDDEYERLKARMPPDPDKISIPFWIFSGVATIALLAGGLSLWVIFIKWAVSI